MAVRIKNIAHPKSPTQRKIRRQESAKTRQERWDNMTTAEKLQQKIDQGHEESLEAGVLFLKIQKELRDASEVQ